MTLLPENVDPLFALTASTKWSGAVMEDLYRRIEALAADTVLRRGGSGAVFMHPVAGETIPAGFPVGLVYDEGAPLAVKYTDTSEAAGAVFVGFAHELAAQGAHVKVVCYGFIARNTLVKENLAGTDTDLHYALLKSDSAGTVYFASKSKLGSGKFIGFVTEGGDVFVCPGRDPKPIAAREKTQRVTASSALVLEHVTTVFVDTDSGEPSYTITMPTTPCDGQRLTIIDSGDNALTANIDLLAGAGHSMPYTVLDADSMAVTFVFSESHAAWFALSRHVL